MAGGATSAGDESPPQLVVVPVRHYGRWVVAALLVALIADMVVGIAGNENIDFATVSEYLFDPTVMEGLRNTVLLTVVSMGITVALGIVVALMRNSANPVARTVAIVYVWLLRGIPALLLIILIFNLGLVVSTIRIGVPGTDLALGSWETNALITPFIAAALALGLSESAYYAEIVRGGILGVPLGSIEAAHAVGMNPFQTFRRIIWPQALRIIIPPTGNTVIGMLKYTSLASVIGVTDLTGGAEQIAAKNTRTIELLLVAAIWYLLATTFLSVAQYFLERRAARGYGRGGETPSSLQEIVKRAWTLRRPVG